MRRSAAGLAVVSVLALATVASAQEGGGGSWTYGAPLGAGRSAIDAQFGFPDISVGYLTSMNDRMDIGGHFAFMYGVEGDPSFFNGGGLVPGIKLAGDLKYLVARSGRADIMLAFSPALVSYFKNGASIFGLQLPVPELVVGLPISAPLLVHFGIKIPWTIGITTGNGQSLFTMLIPISIGGGMEFQIDSRLSLTFGFRIGPEIEDIDGNVVTDPAFEALFGVTYRL
jgi:hypothetical protein